MSLIIGVYFNRAMHCSAKRGRPPIEIACRPSVRTSVCLSVTLVDQDHIGWKSWKLIARTISPTSSLFVVYRTVPSPTPYDLSFPKIGGLQPQPQTAIAIISAKGKAMDFKFGWFIHRSIRTKAHSKLWKKGSVGLSRNCPNFLSTPYYLRNG